MNAELKREPFCQTVYCVKCSAAVEIRVEPELSATAAILVWLQGGQTCNACKQKERS